MISRILGLGLVALMFVVVAFETLLASPATEEIITYSANGVYAIAVSYWAPPWSLDLGVSTVDLIKPAPWWAPWRQRQKCFSTKGRLSANVTWNDEAVTVRYFKPTYGHQPIVLSNPTEVVVRILEMERETGRIRSLLN